MSYARCLSIIALVIALLTFGINYWWNQKQYLFSVFLQFVFKEAEFASVYKAKHSSNQNCGDELVRYLNLLEALSITYENSTIDKKLSKHYFRKIALDLDEDFSNKIKPEYYPSLRRLIKEWKK